MAQEQLHIFIGTAILVVASACGGQHEQQNVETKPLNIVEATADRLEGTFVDEDGETVDFAMSAGTDHHHVLLSMRGEEILSYRYQPTADGFPDLDRPHSLAIAGEELDTAGSVEAARTRLVQFRQSEEAAAIERLMTALGDELGVDGARYAPLTPLENAALFATPELYKGCGEGHGSPAAEEGDRAEFVDKFSIGFPSYNQSGCYHVSTCAFGQRKCYRVSCIRLFGTWICVNGTPSCFNNCCY